MFLKAASHWSIVEKSGAERTILFEREDLMYVISKAKGCRHRLQGDAQD